MTRDQSSSLEALESQISRLLCEYAVMVDDKLPPDLAEIAKRRVQAEMFDQFHWSSIHHLPKIGDLLNWTRVRGRKK